MHWETRHEKIAQLLARRLVESGQPEQTRVTVAELHRVLLPYHECREALGFATKAEYDLALLRFLKTGHYVRIGETGLARAVEDELSSPEPGLAFLKNFAAAQLQVRSPAVEEPASPEGPSADRTAADGPPEEGTERWLEALEPTSRPSGTNGRDRGEEGDGSAAAVERPGGETEGATMEASCRSCAGPLPGRSGLRFCPHCGADQRLRRCGRCGEDLELEWAYCPRCGAAAGEG